MRRKLSFPRGKAQPWVVEPKPAEHTVTLEFTVHSEIDCANENRKFQGIPTIEKTPG